MGIHGYVGGGGGGHVVIDLVLTLVQMKFLVVAFFNLRYEMDYQFQRVDESDK